MRDLIELHVETYIVHLWILFSFLDNHIDQIRVKQEGLYSQIANIGNLCYFKDYVYDFEIN